jgi:hypothetical protein
LNVRAANLSDPADAIADFVLARRVRMEVIEICRKWLAENPAPPAATTTPDEAKRYAANRYWVLATLGEALLGVGDPSAKQQLDAAYASPAEDWMKESTREQIAKLEKLLANPPLNRIR